MWLEKWVTWCWFCGGPPIISSWSLDLVIAEFAICIAVCALAANILRASSSQSCTSRGLLFACEIIFVHSLASPLYCIHFEMCLLILCYSSWRTSYLTDWPANNLPIQHWHLYHPGEHHRRSLNEDHSHTIDGINSWQAGLEMDARTDA